MRSALPFTIPLLVAAGCTHRTTVSHGTIPAAPAAFQRQIVNAVDAGEGDTLVRGLRKRIIADPSDTKARMDLAARYQSQGFPELALEHYRIAAARAPHLSGVQMTLAKSLHALDERKAAIEVLVTFCNSDATPPVELISLLGIYQDQAGDFVPAETSYRSGLKLAPKNDSLHNNLGYNLLLQGKPAEAIAELRTAVALNSRSEVARNNLAMALAQPDGDLKEALLQLETVTDAATAHSNLASILIDQKRYVEARAEIGLALGYSRGNQAALSNLATLSELDGQPATVGLTKSATHHGRISSALRSAFTGTKQDRNSN